MSDHFQKCSDTMSDHSLKVIFVSVVAHAHMHCQLSLTSFPLHSELGRANKYTCATMAYSIQLQTTQTDINLWCTKARKKHTNK